MKRDAVIKILIFYFIFSCNSNAKPPSTVKVLLVGGDWLQGALLRHYVELLGSVLQIGSIIRFTYFDHILLSKETVP